MKILYCIPTLEIGGAERQLSYLASELASGGHSVHIACGRGGALRAPLVAAGVTVHEIGGRGHHDPRLLVRLVRLIRDLEPDIVQTCLTQMDIAGGIAALVTRTAWVLRESSAAQSYPRGWKSRVRQILGRRAAAIVSNSRGGDAYWRDAGAPRRSIVRNAVPLAEIDRAPHASSRRQTVLFAGRMDEGKNAATVLDAVLHLDLDVDAVFCGDGPCRPELERSAAGRVEFPAYVGDLWSRMKAAAVLISLSRYEGSSNVIAEAMVARCPLVVSDIDAHREVLDAGCALFVAAGDAAAATAAIRATLLSPADARRRADAAREKVAQWSVAAMVRDYLEIYATLIG